jgi:hypothetical protein
MKYLVCVFFVALWLCPGVVMAQDNPNELTGHGSGGRSSPGPATRPAPPDPRSNVPIPAPPPPPDLGHTPPGRIATPPN